MYRTYKQSWHFEEKIGGGKGKRKKRECKIQNFMNMTLFVMSINCCPIVKLVWSMMIAMKEKNMIFLFLNPYREKNEMKFEWFLCGDEKKNVIFKLDHTQSPCINYLHVSSLLFQEYLQIMKAYEQRNQRKCFVSRSRDQFLYGWAYWMSWNEIQLK